MSSKIKSLPTFRQSQSFIRPVSRVWFDLTDRNSFDQCIACSIDWMLEQRNGLPRSGVDLPAAAREGLPFDVTDEYGANPTKATRIDASDGSLWVARLDFPDPDQPRSWVSEFFVDRRQERLVRFGAQLTCIARGECGPYDLTLQSVVPRVLEKMSAEADGRSLPDTVERAAATEVPELIDLLYSTKRRLPVIVVSENDAQTTEIRPDRLVRRLAGAAHIVHLSDEASWELTRRVGKRMSVFGGAIRLYRPVLTDEREEPFEHPLWLPQGAGENAILRQLANRVLPATFLRENQNELFPRYAVVRDAVARLVLENTAPGDEGAQAAAELIVTRLELDERAEESDAWQSLAQEAVEGRNAAELEIERLRAEVSRLESKSQALAYTLTQRDAPPDGLPKSDRALLSFADLEDWADEVLGESVYIHQAALKDCRKTGHENMLSRVESALLIMRDHMTPFRRLGDVSLKEDGIRKLREMGIEDSPCFVDRHEAKRRPAYNIMHEGMQYTLENHLKYGNGYDNSNQIRIYYFWDGNKKRYVIGKMPSHLPNNLTT